MSANLDYTNKKYMVEEMIYSDKELTPNEKLTIILDYFLQHPNEYIRPITILKKIGVKHTQKRAFYKYCQTLKDFAIIDSKNPYSGLTNEKDTEYILTKNKEVEFAIPNDSKKRFMYAQSIVILLTGFKVDTVTDERVLPAVRTSIYSMLISLGSGLTREALISSKLYNYFKLSKGSLLTIMTEISQYDISISIDIKVDNSIISIENNKIKKVSLKKNEKLQLSLSNTKVILNSFSDIQNIKILSENYPISKKVQPKIFKKHIIDEIKTHSKYGKMVEEYENLINLQRSDTEENINMNFDDFINDMLNKKVEDTCILDKVNRYLVKKTQ